MSRLTPWRMAASLCPPLQPLHLFDCSRRKFLGASTVVSDDWKCTQLSFAC